MTEEIRRAMSKVNPGEIAELTEISLYIGKPPAFVYPGRISFLTCTGSLVSDGHSGGLLIISSSDISSIVSSISHHSIHSCERQLHQGFFILPGGMRVGVAGTYTTSGILKDWNSLNFRFASEHKGCADRLFPLVNDGLIICGSVNSGKTTVLRELCRLTGDTYKTALIDERGEISALSGGQAQFDVGLLTNILSGCTRAEGITTAVRTLSPNMIFTDEIVSSEDASAIIDGAGCGVRFTATMHARDMDDLRKRPAAKQLLDAGVFGNAVFLAGSTLPGMIREIRQLNDVS